MSTPADFDSVFARICAEEGPLRERLKALTGITEKFFPDYADACAELAETLRAAAAGGHAPEVGDEMPPFLLPDQSGHLVNSDELIGRGPLVVSFNRGHWCEYCTLELTHFCEAHARLVAAGARVVSIMPERAEFTRKVAARCGHAFPVLSDMDNAYALELDLVVWLGERIIGLMKGAGLDLERYQGNGAWFVPIPATFVVGRDGRILARMVDPDFRERMPVEAILAALAA